MKVNPTAITTAESAASTRSTPRSGRRGGKHRLAGGGINGHGITEWKLADLQHRWFARAVRGKGHGVHLRPLAHETDRDVAPDRPAARHVFVQRLGLAVVLD